MRRKAKRLAVRMLFAVVVAPKGLIPILVKLITPRRNEVFDGDCPEP